MDRFASMHDEDIDKLGIPKQGAGGGEEGWKGRKRARELSELKDRLDRASEKEQQSWDRLKKAVEGGGGSSAIIDEGRFEAKGSNRAADEMRERTVGLVTAQEFREAREAADSLEAAEAERREEARAKDEEAKEALRKKAEKKKKKAADKKRRLEKSKMSFALEEDDEGGGGKQEPVDGNPRSSGQPNTSPQSSGGDDKRANSSEAVGKLGVTEGAGSGGADGETRSLKGAAPDEDNSSAASLLRARLGR